MKTRYPELKAELKALAKEIKEQKWLRDHWYETDKQQWVYQLNVARLAWKFRHKHIAYCQLHGTPYFMIECPRNDNKPDKRYVREIMEKYEQKTELRAV